MDSDELRRSRPASARTQDTTMGQKLRAALILALVLLINGGIVRSWGWLGLGVVMLGGLVLISLYCIYQMILIAVQAWDERRRQ